MFHKIFNLVLIGTLFISSCKQGADNQSKDEMDLNDSSVQEDHLSRVKKIFYNVPSPIEMANLTRNLGVVYTKELLNPASKVDNYNTTASLALNLGVYGADLSYCRIYDQIQESVNYLAATKRITEALKIPQEEGSFALNRLEENINNRDTLLQIIADVYSSADIYLKENDRGSTSVLIILGGWIEALYIGTNMVDEKKPDEMLMKRIAEQKYSIENLIQLLELYPENKNLSEKMLPQLKNIQMAFNEIPVTQGESTVNTDKSTGVTTIGGSSEVKVNIDHIVKIKGLISTLRNEIVK